jgi:hypothetical protein
VRGAVLRGFSEVFNLDLTEVECLTLHQACSTVPLSNTLIASS